METTAPAGATTRKRRSPISPSSSPATPRGSTDPVTAYAQAVVDREVATGRLVRLACERHLRDLAVGAARGLRWHPEAGLYAIRAFSLLKQSKGEFAGRVLQLEPWQKFVIGSVFGWKGPDGFRRFRYVYEELPRKNGKSTKLAGVGIIGTLFDGEGGAEVYAAATKKDQARIIFEEARRMVLKSPELSGELDVYKLNISHQQSGSKFEPLSSDEQTLDGLNPHFILIDELHKHKNRLLLEVLDTATGSRRQPLLWIITTAGDESSETPYAVEHDDAVKVLEGMVEDDRLFAFIASADPEDDPFDPLTWEKANPNWLVSVKRADMERQAAKAKRAPSALASFKRLRLNIRTGAAADPLFTKEAWLACERTPEEMPPFKGRSVYGGLDLSGKLDLTALAIAARNDDGSVDAFVEFWTPLDTLADREIKDRAPYSVWRDQGQIVAVPGVSIDYAHVAKRIGALQGEVDLKVIAYDMWRIEDLKRELEREGVEAELQPFGQGFKSMSPAIDTIEELVAAGKLRVWLNKCLRWNVANVKVVKDAANNRKLDKKKSTGRIDGLPALTMAVKLAVANAAPEAPTFQMFILGGPKRG